MHNQSVRIQIFPFPFLLVVRFRLLGWFICCVLTPIIRQIGWSHFHLFLVLHLNKLRTYSRFLSDFVHYTIRFEHGIPSLIPLSIYGLVIFSVTIVVFKSTLSIAHSSPPRLFPCVYSIVLHVLPIHLSIVLCYCHVQCLTRVWVFSPLSNTANRCAFPRFRSSIRRYSFPSIPYRLVSLQQMRMFT